MLRPVEELREKEECLAREATQGTEGAVTGDWLGGK